ncbi:hypothetical protein PP175_17360 [Aneurinibacillus sp. Ricciae_BoGa-3]|uniref:hypothetical protein n=1 Tax=Aneurinibacillus sp. Ricciae_BoGa-3 TaxID=3022697 RepID=UPI0023423C55|nr:hypothetical protein [Aneurinibacillus sp. Ricciae_BoGa-3]WCK53162.1 hypothetical protein PP175_17360 [Aneurinibacillus sp. Ricciae_BoGa-3]
MMKMRKVRSEKRMATNYRLLSGYASIITGILFILAHTLNLGGPEDFGTVTGETLVLAAHSLLVFVFFAIFALHGERNGILGLLGMALGIIGTILVTAIVYVEIACGSGAKVDSVLAADVPRTIHSFGPLLFVAGMILFGISVVRENVLSRGGGYLLIAGTLFFVVASFTGAAQSIIEVIGAVFTGGGLIWMGFPMVKNQKPVVGNNHLSR